MKKLTDEYPELLADLAEQVASKLMAVGLTPEKAADIGFSTAEFIREHWSGDRLYLPKGVTYVLARRDLELYERFTGDNHSALAKEYNLTVIRIYQIVKRVRAEHIKKCQGALF